MIPQPKQLTYLDQIIGKRVTNAGWDRGDIVLAFNDGESFVVVEVKRGKAGWHLQLSSDARVLLSSQIRYLTGLISEEDRDQENREQQRARAIYLLEEISGDYPEEIEAAYHALKKEQPE